MFTLLEVMLLVVYIITLYYTLFWLVALLDYEPAAKKPLKRLPKVTVIVPAYNEEAHLEKTVSSILCLDYPEKLLEVVIVNDGSTDKTLSVARKLMRGNGRVKVLDQVQGGKWKAMNSGIAVSSGEFVACLDSDSTVKKDALKKMLPFFVDENVAVVLPMLHVDRPENLLQKIQWHEYIVNMFYRKVAGMLNCIHVAPGPFSLYRKKTIEAIGGFREGYSTEDLEICMRLQSLNYKIVQTTETEAYTEAPRKISEFYKQRLRWNLGSTLNILSYRKMLFSKRYGDFGTFQLPMIFFATFFAVLVLCVTIYLSIFKPIYEKIAYLSLVNFDVLTLLRSLHFNKNLLDMDYFSLFMAVSFFLISGTVIVLAHRAVKQKINGQGIRALALFMFVYYLLLGFVRMIVIRDLFFRKRNKW